MAVSEPIISFSCAAIRDFRYRDCYESLAINCKTPFEMVFVGHKPPKEKMPKDFHYIYTEVKPAQCYEIAVRNSRGYFVQIIADDEKFDKGYVDRLYKYTQLLDMDKILITIRLLLMIQPRIFKRGPKRGKRQNKNIKSLFADNGFIFDSKARNAPFMGFAPLFRRDVWTELGGIDKKFNGSFSDMEMQLRFYKYGFTPFLTPDIVGQEHNFYDIEGENNSLICRTGQESWRLLSDLWIKDGAMSDVRLLPMESFNNEGILTENQYSDIWK